MDTVFESAGGLTVLATDDGGSDIFATFFEGYDQAFTLPDEKEDRTGFVDCMALNHAPEYARISASLGRFRELVVIAEIDGRTIGGANFLVTPSPGRHVVTLHLNYAYVLPGMRGQGLLRRLVDACRELAERTYPAAGPVVVFLELNDPLLLTAEQYEQDSAASGVDQFDRVAIWARLGIRVVDFPYVQPPLSATQQADVPLILAVLADRDFEFDGGLLADHLERFFAISVLKNGDVETNDLAAAQVRECRGRGAIALLDPLPALDGLRGQVGRTTTGVREHLAKATSRPV
ncbi:MAG: GNAT family N-acetyltransferase [Umezawaea sp.]